MGSIVREKENFMGRAIIVFVGIAVISSAYAIQQATVNGVTWRFEAANNSSRLMKIGRAHV